MSWSDEDERRVGIALRDAKDRLGQKATGADIIFEVIRRAAEINRRELVRGHSPDQKKSAWLLDVTHEDLSLEDKAEIAKQRMIDLQAGDPFEVVFGVTLLTTPAELALRDAIVAIFRQCLVGQKQARDWRMLIDLLARGKPMDRVARILRMSRWSVQDRKKLQCTAIWSRVKGLIPARSVVLREAVSHGQAA